MSSLERQKVILDEPQIDQIRTLIQCIFQSGIHLTGEEAQLLLQALKHTRQTLQSNNVALRAILLKASKNKFHLDQPGRLKDTFLRYFLPKKYSKLVQHRKTIEATLMAVESHISPPFPTIDSSSPTSGRFGLLIENIRNFLLGFKASL